jgi:hypothetical protein
MPLLTPHRWCPAYGEASSCCLRGWRRRTARYGGDHAGLSGVAGEGGCGVSALTAGRTCGLLCVVFREFPLRREHSRGRTALGRRDGGTRESWRAHRARPGQHLCGLERRPRCSWPRTVRWPRFGTCVAVDRQGRRSHSVRVRRHGDRPVPVEGDRRGVRRGRRQPKVPTLEMFPDGSLYAQLATMTWPQGAHGGSNAPERLHGRRRLSSHCSDGLSVIGYRDKVSRRARRSRTA